MDHTVCPGSKFMRQPKPEQFPCPKCGSEVEIWSDEISGKCGSCGTTVVRDGTMSCIEWCAMAKDCVGDDVYNDFQDRKATTIKDRLISLASSSPDTVNSHLVERALFYAENIARSEEADVHVVLAATALGIIYSDGAAREELLKMGFQLEAIEEVCAIILSPQGGLGDISNNEAVTHDARLLATIEERSAAGYSGDPDYDPDTIRFQLKTRSGSELARHAMV